MRLRWPPPPLGLGTPFNFAALSAETRPLLTRSWWLIPSAGLLTACALFAVDYAFFGGATFRATPSLASHPPVASRVLVSLVGSFGEELVFRGLLASTAGWLVFLALRGGRHPERIAQAVAVVAAAVAVGLMHVGQTGKPSELWRIMTINAVGHGVYGTFFFARGFEVAMLTHAVVTALLYIGWPALR